jgi:PKD repeat protein
VTQTYTNAGSYTVALVVMGTGGTNTLTKTAYIVVTNPPPTAAFTGGPTNGPAPLAVTFTNNSMYESNSIWSFGDGSLNVTNATGANVVHTYTTAGTNTVILTVTGTGGAKSLTNTAYIVVTAGHAVPPTIGGVTVAGGKLGFSGANGTAGQQYRILTATSVAVPLANWTPVWTNVFAADGSYSYTNTLGTNAAAFFLLVSP